MYVEHDGEPSVRCGVWWLISGALLVLVLGALIGVLAYRALATTDQVCIASQVATAETVITVPVSCT